MSPLFDVKSEDHFLQTLSDFGRSVATFVVYDLLVVASGLQWKDFEHQYNWREHERVPVDTYPGVTIYYCFDVVLPADLQKESGIQEVVVYATNYGDELVLCNVAKKKI